jgi:two-component system response regulator FixJ
MIRVGDIQVSEIDNADIFYLPNVEAVSTKRTSVHIVDRDSARRANIAALVFACGHHAEVYADHSEFLAYAPKNGILLAYVEPSHGDVVALIKRMTQEGSWLPVIAMADRPEINSVVATIKAGAIDFLGCPLERSTLLNAIEAAMRDSVSLFAMQSRAAEARQRIARLSVREREVLDLVSDGCSNKEIARQLEISPRTVEIHRMKMMGKLGIRRTSEAVRLRIEAIGLEKSAPLPIAIG